MALAGRMPDDEPSSLKVRRERQRAFWRERYLEEPAFFGEAESGFARWCLPLLRAEKGLDSILELGCGYGRDSRFLASEGFRVVGVDLTTVRPDETSSSRETPSRFRLIESDAAEYLARVPSQKFDAVYSNMFFNMDFSESEHRSLMKAIRSALRPGGLHLYSARSTFDPWYGRGRSVGPDTFEASPGGAIIHFFSMEYVDRLAEGLFTPVERSDQAEGGEDFPIRLLYVVDRRT